jgi:hypothetical protein
MSNTQRLRRLFVTMRKKLGPFGPAMSESHGLVFNLLLDFMRYNRELLGLESGSGDERRVIKFAKVLAEREVAREEGLLGRELTHDEACEFANRLGAGFLYATESVLKKEHPGPRHFPLPVS